MDFSIPFFCLTILSGLPSCSSVAPTTVVALSSQAVDLKGAVDQFFKKGTLREGWFAPMEPEKFSKFRKQALAARQQAFKKYGAYKSVQRQGNECIVTFAKGEMTLVFQLNTDGRITSLGIK
jgi:hypothetical protein